MKTLLKSLILPLAFFAAVATAVHASGQTVTNLLSGPSGSMIQDLAYAGEDLYADYQTAKPYALTNSSATLQIGGGRNTTTKNWIEAAIVTVPMTNGMRIGAIVAHIGSQWYEGGVNAGYGLTKDFPIIGTATAFFGDGVVYDFITRAPANYAYAGFEKNWVISKKWEAGAGVLTANTSDRPGVDFLAGLHATLHF